MSYVRWFLGRDEGQARIVQLLDVQVVEGQSQCDYCIR